MEIKRAESGHLYGTVANQPADQYVFVGDGPWFVFEHHDWYRFSLSAALNFFERLRAENKAEVQNQTRSYVFSEDGKRYYYEEFRVKLPMESRQSVDAVDPHATSTGKPSTRV